MKIRGILLLIALAILSSCDLSKRKPLKPTPSGAPGDVLLVMNEKLWQSFSGDSIRSILASPVDALPQDEPRFDVIRINHNVFGKTFMSQRNIIIVKVGSDQPETKLLVQNNQWARTQLLITILAPDEDALVKVLNENRDKIITLMINAELKRLMDTFNSLKDKTITDRLMNEQNILLTIPKGYDINTFEQNFIWISQEYRDIIQAIIIYSYPYTAEKTFTRDYLVARRNDFLKRYVPGEISGSFMITEPLFPPLFREFNLNNDTYTAELRGLWRIQDGLAMGGPFVSITQLDEQRNRIVTVEGFVYAPGHEKRDLLQQLEAIIFTLDFTDKQSVVSD